MSSSASVPYVMNESIGRMIYFVVWHVCNWQSSWSNFMSFGLLNQRNSLLLPKSSPQIIVIMMPSQDYCNSVRRIIIWCLSEIESPGGRICKNLSWRFNFWTVTNVRNWCHSIPGKFESKHTPLTPTGKGVPSSRWLFRGESSQVSGSLQEWTMGWEFKRCVKKNKDRKGLCVWRAK